MLTVAGKKTAARKEREIQTDRQTERVGERGRGREREGEGWRERERDHKIYVRPIMSLTGFWSHIYLDIYHL